MNEQSTKERLLEAAIVMINEKGEAGVRVEELLREVGVSAPTMYHHFGNREGLILAAQVERFIRTLRTDFPIVIAAFNRSETVEDLKEAVRIAVTFRGDASRMERQMQRLNALGSAYARPELAAGIVKAHEDIVRQVADAMRPFQERGMIRADIDLEMVVAWFNGTVLGAQLLEIAPSTLDISKWAEIMTDAVEHILFGT